MQNHGVGRRKLHLALLMIFLPTLTTAIWPFPPKRFRGNSLIDAGTMGLTGDLRVVAFGDFNEDQFLDVLALSSDQRTLSVHLWNHEQFTFREATSLRHHQRIVNVVPSDFTHNGRLDLLVMSNGQTAGQLDLTLYPALAAGGFDVNNPLSIPPSSTSQPIPIDLNGDMKADLLGMPPPSSRDSKYPFQAWQNIWNESQANSPIFETKPPAFSGGAQCVLADPHSNAVVDLNGDCLADLFLVCDDGGGRRSYQIWINEKDAGFSLAQKGSLPSGFQSASFADIDRDGTIDMIFTTCESVSPSTGIGSNCYINVAYNQQLRLCSSSTTSGMKGGVRVCRSPEELCLADPNFKFSLDESAKPDAFVRFSIASLFPTSPPSSLLVLDTTFNPPLPLPLKLGDVDLDGFPDLLAIIVSGRDRTPKVVMSVPCAKGVIGCVEGAGKRGWKVAGKGSEPLSAVTDARSVSFLDMDEDGTLDIMVQRSGESGRGHVLLIQNNFYYDAFFLKAIVLNGACNNGLCHSNGSSGYNPFGVSYSGPSYKYTVLDTSGRRSAAQAGQLPQTGYHSLQTPYSFFGLGRTNNYIENLFVGSTMHTDTHFINMEGVIPNSRVVIKPASKDGEAWKRQLFLRPGEWIPWVTLTMVAGTFILAIIVFVLHLNEKREDELERRRASHHINFDAL